ncbi:MAG TPA: EAL domain-containing protein [Vicinamibacteria bacterium]|nr:EAL domain-containing protein [Vicinamibacteria bacterium]
MGRRCLLETILEPGSLRVLFQPVFEADAGRMRVHYLESLVRGPEGTSLEAPEVLFDYAGRKNAAAAVDRACVRTILETARSLPPGATLGINVHASTLAHDPEFLSFLGDTASLHMIDPSRIVLEIVEHAPPWDMAAFRTSLEGLRDIGVRVALDDVGLGHSNFLMILECRPEYFKIDRYFVADSPRDFHRRVVLASIAELAARFGGQAIAEGVETRAELEAVRNLGIELVQGWLFGPARPATQPWGPQVMKWSSL